MSDALQTALGKARSAMSGFTPGQIGVIGVAIAALVAAGIFLSRMNAAPFTPLYSNLASADAAKVVQELDAAGVAYQLEDGGNTILVPQDKVYAERIALSLAGNDAREREVASQRDADARFAFRRSQPP